MMRGRNYVFLLHGGIFISIKIINYLIIGGGMKFKISIFSLFFILCFSLSVRAKMLNLNGFVLDNGLKVVVAQNKKAPVIMHKLYYKVGSVDDPIYKGGVAHLLEHLMFRGTKNVKDREFNYLTEMMLIYAKSIEDENRITAIRNANSNKIKLGIIASEVDLYLQEMETTKYVTEMEGQLEHI